MSTPKKRTTKRVTQKEAAQILKEKGAQKATIADLIPEEEQTKWVTVQGLGEEPVSIEIRKVVMEDMSSIGKLAGEDPHDNLMGIVNKGMKTPKLSLPQIKKMEAKVCISIARIILEYSELREEDLERAKNLQGQGKDMASGT